MPQLVDSFGCSSLEIADELFDKSKRQCHLAFRHAKLRAQVDFLQVLNLPASEAEELIDVLARLLFGGHQRLPTFLVAIPSSSIFR